MYAQDKDTNPFYQQKGVWSPEWDTRCRPWYVSSVLNNAYGKYKDKVFLGAPYAGAEGKEVFVTVSKFLKMRGEGKHAVLGVDLDLNWKLYKDVIGDQ